MQIIKVSSLPNLKEADVLLVLHKDAYVRFNEYDAGIDLSSIDDIEVNKLSALVKIHTGVKLVIPKGLVGKIYPRSSTFKQSGMLLADGMGLVNSIGIIDPSYRGEILCFFVIFDKTLFLNKFPNKIIPKHTRLAQLIIEPISIFPNRIYILQDDDVYENIGNIFPTKRGSKGFGSTGLF